MDGNVLGKITGGAGLGFFILKLGGTGEYKWHAWGSSSGTGATVRYFDFVLRNNSEITYMVSAKGDVPVRNSNGGSATFTGLGNTSTGRYGVLLIKVKTTANSAATASAKIGSTTNSVEAYCMAEHAGTIFFTGTGGGTVDFDPESGTANLAISNKGYFCALDTNLKYSWAKTLLKLEQIYRIGVDAWGNLRGIGVETGTGVSHLTFCTITQGGQILREYDESFSPGFHEISQVIADRGGNIFVTGTFQGSGDFDPTSASKTEYGGTRTAFIVKYDSAFEAKWLVTGSSASTFDNAGNAVFLDKNNVLQWGGAYSRTLVFSGNSGITMPYTIPAYGFIAYLTECKNFNPQITPSDTAVCSGNSVLLKVNGTVGIKWLADQDTVSSKTISPVKTNIYQAEVYDGMDCYKSIESKVIVHPAPNPVITSAGNKVSVTGTWKKIEWYLNGQKQNGQNGADFYPGSNGQVYCVVTDLNGCDGVSQTIQFNSSSVFKMTAETVVVSSNP